MNTFFKLINDKFLKLADAVSFGMGTPTNIIFWLLAVGIWFALGMTQQELFKNDRFLPGWFTSNAWNFPLNTVTTLLELYIGFLVAAAANRSERKIRKLIEQTKFTVESVKKISIEQNKILELLIKYEKKELQEEREIYKQVKKKKRDR